MFSNQTDPVLMIHDPNITVYESLENNWGFLYQKKKKKDFQWKSSFVLKREKNLG